MNKFSKKTIGQYQIRSRLGQGTMGQVYKVIEPGKKGFAALKVLKPNPGLIKKMGMAWAYDTFVREVLVASGFDHPHVVKARHLEETEGLTYYLMEYFPRNLGIVMGESYWADRPSRVLRIGMAVDYILETLAGLSGLHQAGIVHQDIKPFNLMLTEQGRIKIADFGLSKRRGETVAATPELMIGTPFYAAPEQAAFPEHSDNRADLYSVGVLLYRMLTGVLPQQPVKLPGTVNKDLDSRWDELILKAIHQDPAHRFQDAESMHSEIQRLYLDFKHNRQQTCLLSAQESSQQTKPGKPEVVTLRSKSDLVLAKHATSVFHIDDCHQPLQYLDNSFDSPASGVVLDRRTGLRWQQAGSERPMPWEEAEHYITGLNAQKAGGIENWRLPTMNELLSLLNPPPPGEDFCFQTPMSSVQKWIWSGDSRSKRAAWFVDVQMGFVASGDILDGYYVKAVSSA